MIGFGVDGLWPRRTTRCWRRSRPRSSHLRTEGRAVYTYVVRAQRREQLREYLLQRGVETAVYYPRPLHLQPVFAALGHRIGDFPVAERLGRECLALPLYPEMADSEAEYVACSVAEFYRRWP